MTQKVFALNELGKFQKFLSSDLQGISVSDHELLCDLVNNKIIVEDTAKEKFVSELSYYDSIYDTTCNLTILPTEQCNFRCVYCYEKYNHGKMSVEIADNILKYLAKNARKFSGINVSWFGGEPLLAVDVIEYISKQIIQISKFYHIPYVASMTTNGYLLDYETFEKLLELKIFSYQLTIDGTEESHDKTRYTIGHEKSYRRIINNLVNIKNKVKNKHFTISIRCNLTVESINVINNFINEMDYYFGGDKRFEFYFRPVGNWLDSKIDEANILKSDDIILEKLLLNPKKLNYNSYYNLLFAQQCISLKRNHYVIRSNGDVAKCTVYLDESIIGKVESSGKLQLNYEKLGRWIFPENVDSSCKECAFWGKCHGHSCPVKKISANHSDKKDCGYELNSIEKIIDLIEQSDKYNGFSNIILLDVKKEN